MSLTLSIADVSLREWQSPLCEAEQRRNSDNCQSSACFSPSTSIESLTRRRASVDVVSTLFYTDMQSFSALHCCFHHFLLLMLLVLFTIVMITFFFFLFLSSFSLFFSYPQRVHLWPFDFILFYFIYLRVCLDCKLGASVQNCVCLSVCQMCVSADGYVSACVSCTTCS